MLDVGRWALGVFASMKPKRIVVMGFMGSMPIAGVIWQHIHYIVGLQRLHHDVYYIEDSARLPYNPETFEVTDEFIREMPQGYSSLVGERGGHLSVGQRQRIGIARAFLKNAPILLLDEPTSALDPATESAIMETIKELMRGRTTLIATHRLATIHNLDQIIVLDHGRIIEQGRGPELIARGGIYAKLYSSGHFPS
jgi:ABC-type multidrug transport system ATPase subunit